LLKKNGQKALNSRATDTGALLHWSPTAERRLD
jgi:hypothetical protein